MDHPNIAKFHDATRTETGFFLLITSEIRAA